jgi:hypothetical protein
VRKIFVGVGIIVGLLVATNIQSLAQDDLLLGFCMHDQTGNVRLDTECTTQETPYNLPSENIVQSLVPAGTIVMWSGSIDDIPEGWALCDGTAPTPDLRNRFIVGASQSLAYAVGDTGGQDDVTLAINNMPTHSHNVSITSTSSSGSHSHSAGTYYTPNSGGHRHNYLDKFYDGEQFVDPIGLSKAADNDRDDLLRDTGSGGDHGHSVAGQSGSAGNHNHSVTGTTTSSGSGGAFDIRPYYYALAYIMKLPPPE